MNHAYHGKERSDQNLKTRFEDFIHDEKNNLRARVKSLNDSDLAQLGRKAITFAKENPDVILGALVTVGAASFTAIKILALTNKRYETEVRH